MGKKISNPRPQTSTSGSNRMANDGANPAQPRVIRPAPPPPPPPKRG